MKSYGGVDVYLQSFLSSTPYGDKTVSFNTPSSLAREKRLCRSLDCPPFWKLWGRGEKTHASAGNRITVPPESNRYFVVLLITIIQVQHQIRLMLPCSSWAHVHFWDVKKQHFLIWPEYLHHQYASNFKLDIQNFTSFLSPRDREINRHTVMPVVAIILHSVWRNSTKNYATVDTQGVLQERSAIIRWYVP